MGGKIVMATMDAPKKRTKKTTAVAPEPDSAVTVSEPLLEGATTEKSKTKGVKGTPKEKGTTKGTTKGKPKGKTKEITNGITKGTPTEDEIGSATASSQPALFIEEVEAPLPTPPAKKGRKPPIVASITPEGIHGSLQNNDQRPLIAHLPIHGTDIDSELFCATKQKEELEGMPNPYDPEDVYSTFDQDKLQPAMFDIQTKKVEREESKTVQSCQPIGRPSLPLHYSEKLMIRYQDSNREQKIPETVDLACFWDCHPFRTQPCIIPITIEEGIWRVYGNFCSPECAAAFLFHERLDSHAQWERYALLNRLYSSDEFNDIRLAPSRSTLRLFGGIMDVSEFRDITKERRMRIDVMTPPMISIIQVMDTKPIDFYDASMKNTFIPWEMDRMNRPGAQGLRLQRSKPVVKKESTLEFCMGLTAKS